jgi:hypothetical protein
MAAHRRSLEPFRFQFGQECKVVERDEQRRVAHLAERKLGLEEVALLDGAGEASMCGPLACHLPKRGRRERVYASRVDRERRGRRFQNGVQRRASGTCRKSREKRKP